MTTATLYALTGIALFALALVGALTHPQWLKKILALNVMGTGTFLFLVAVADRRPGLAPDPVPHAMVLTGIVVAVSATAVALALASRVAEETAPDIAVGELADEDVVDIYCEPEYEFATGAACHWRDDGGSGDSAGSDDRRRR